jgi:hypothetical protein
MKLILILCTLFFSVNLNAQSFNRPTLPDFPAYEFEIIDSSYTGFYTFTAKGMGGVGNTTWMGIMDSQGYLVWVYGSSSRKNDFHYQHDYQVFTFAESLDGLTNHNTLDTNLVIVNTITAPNEFIGDVHEYLLLPNGNAAIIATLDTVMDLSGYTFDGQTGSDSTNLAYNNILEIAPNNDIVFQWKGIDYIAPSEYQDGIFKYTPLFFDYMHANSIDIDFDGHYLFSLRHTNSIIKINRNNGNVIWRLGGNASSFTFPNDSGFSGNHHFQNLGNNRYSLFDNGNTSSSPQESRAVIYKLDTIDMTATREWEYKHAPAVYAPAMGNYQQLKGYGLINWGRVNRPEPTFTVIDTLNNPIVNLFWAEKWISYRSYMADIAINFNRATIKCNNENDQLILTAPESNSYLWNTGETSESITVTAPGTYMVWTPHGMGMLGSYPLQIDQINDFCISTTISEYNSKGDRIIQVFNLLGQLENTPRLGNIYIVKYESGKIIKVLWSDIWERKTDN